MDWTDDPIAALSELDALRLLIATNHVFTTLPVDDWRPQMRLGALLFYEAMTQMFRAALPANEARLMAGTFAEADAMAQRIRRAVNLDP